MYASVAGGDLYYEIAWVECGGILEQMMDPDEKVIAVAATCVLYHIASKEPGQVKYTELCLGIFLYTPR